MNKGEPVKESGDMGPKNIKGNLLLLLGSMNDYRAAMLNYYL